MFPTFTSRKESFCQTLDEFLRTSLFRSFAIDRVFSYHCLSLLVLRVWWFVFPRKNFIFPFSGPLFLKKRPHPQSLSIGLGRTHEIVSHSIPCQPDAICGWCAPRPDTHSISMVMVHLKLRPYLFAESFISTCQSYSSAISSESFQSMLQTVRFHRDWPLIAISTVSRSTFSVILTPSTFCLVKYSISHCPCECHHRSWCWRAPSRPSHPYSHPFLRSTVPCNICLSPWRPFHFSLDVIILLTSLFILTYRQSLRSHTLLGFNWVSASHSHQFRLSSDIQFLVYTLISFMARLIPFNSSHQCIWPINNLHPRIMSKKAFHIVIVPRVDLSNFTQQQLLIFLIWELVWSSCTFTSIMRPSRWYYLRCPRT